jgi:putative peptidoglycan lipid II flippase
MATTTATPPGPARPAGDWQAREPDGRAGSAVIQHSMAGSVGTVVSRVVGLGKTITVAAILGTTYLGNTYQAINSLPNLVYYQLLAGSLFASLLVPPLVRHVDRGDQRGARALANGFLGGLLGVAVLASVALVALGPLVMHLLSLGVPDPATAAAQRRVGWLLLVMFVPQIALYVVAGTGAAAMNARDRFGLAAAAPALESLGMIGVLVAAGVLYGTGTGILQVSQRQLLLLGLGTTAAVGLHAACQWWGARSAGLTLIPTAGWRDPEVLRTLRRIVPTLGFTGLAAAEVFGVLVVASRIQGGLVAFQLALNFFYLPTALVTWPTGRALLPQLARLHHAGDRNGFRDELLRAVILASFITVPVAVGYAALSGTLGHVLAFGQFAHGDGPRLFALSLASLAAGVVGETWFTLGTYAFYARQDVRSPLRSMAVRVAVSLSCMALAWRAHGDAVLIILGLALSLGSLAGAAHVGWRLRSGLPRGRLSLVRRLAQTLAASAVMLVAVRLTVLALDRLPQTRPAQLLTMASTATVGLAVFLGVQAAWRAPELGWLRSALGRGELPAEPRGAAGPSSDGARPGSQLERLRLAVSAPVGRWRPAGGWGRGAAMAAGLFAAACLAGAAITVVPAAMLLLGLVAVLLLTAVAVRPAFGVYLLLAVTPLVAGIDRGLAIPVLRPNEALLVLVGCGLLTRGVVRSAGGSPLRLTFAAIDLPVLALAFTSSVVPLLWMQLRHRAIEQDDVMYALMIWKYYGIYLVARVSVRSERQVRTCLLVSLAAAALVAFIAILQSLHLFGVADTLTKYYAPYGDTGAVLNDRGGSTLSLPIAVADLMTFNLAIAVGMLVRGRGHRAMLLALSGLFVAGVLASAEFSGAIGLVIGIVAIAVLTRRVRVAATFIPALGVAGLALRPVIETRLQGFGSASGLPESWAGRLHNLSNYFWPTLFSDGHFILGVQLAARVRTSTMSLGYIWIESGYTWLLWSGGIPLLLAFGYFLWAGMREYLPLARSRQDAVGVAALAVVVALVVIGVLMLIDPHLTYRGSADLLFVLLGLAAIAGRYDLQERAAAEAGPR